MDADKLAYYKEQIKNLSKSTIEVAEAGLALLESTQDFNEFQQEVVATHKGIAANQERIAELFKDACEVENSDDNSVALQLH
ncbi:hypothetical protein [Caballeronia sp. LZ035]|uniref:hypothetical protein n=1 Tax=Caballeronia sp. LZ035 TaxID=3038568 RepID=UPI0028571ED7|nr:hypothetical protein [Caballeronia sp. LZ035]MDR5757653.1 hypothetical protein [Caballeronia sp. LZ035]